jgi:hypothetical protein
VASKDIFLNQDLILPSPNSIMIRRIKTFFGNWLILLIYCFLVLFLTLFITPAEYFLLYSQTERNETFFQLFFSVAGGVLTICLIEFLKYIDKKYSHFKIKDIFGSDIFSIDGLYLVYAQLALPLQHNADGAINTHPYTKPGEENSGTGFSVQRPVSSCELRAAKYLSEILGRDTGRTPLLISDIELSSRLNASFISFGGPASNHKTRDILRPENNIFDFTDIVSFILERMQEAGIIPEHDVDYGIILKLHPSQFPQKTWITCAGIDEWGTSGSAWYLAYKYGDIWEYTKDSSFLVIVRVRRNQDESAEPIFIRRHP